MLKLIGKPSTSVLLIKSLYLSAFINVIFTNSKHRVEMGVLWNVTYKLITETGSGTTKSGTSQAITVATTRPETIWGDRAIAVHPDDERYKVNNASVFMVQMLISFDSIYITSMLNTLYYLKSDFPSYQIAY